MCLLLLFLLVSVGGTTIGSIKQARISSLAPSIWLYNQSSWSQCMCYARQDPSVVAFNNYASNFSCQLFKNLSSFSFQVINATNVTVYLLQPLQPYVPCCSNLTWLLSQIKSVQTSLSISSIRSIAFDTDRNRLGIVSSNIFRLVSIDSFTLLNSSTSIPTYTAASTYYQDLFYVGTYPGYNNTFYIYSASNLTLVRKINFTEGSPQHVTWLYNETLVCILLQQPFSSYSIVSFYNWPSFTLNYSVNVSITNAYGLTKASNDDTFVYIVDASLNGSVWRMKTSLPYNFTVLIGGSSILEMPTSVVIDSCKTSLDRIFEIWYPNL